MWRTPNTERNNGATALESQNASHEWANGARHNTIIGRHRLAVEWWLCALQEFKVQKFETHDHHCWLLWDEMSYNSVCIINRVMRRCDGCNITHCACENHDRRARTIRRFRAGFAAGDENYCKFLIWSVSKWIL